MLNYLIGAIRRRIVRDIRKQLDVWAFKCVALQTENPKQPVSATSQQVLIV